MIARSLSSKDSFTIGMIIPGVGENQYAKILEGAAKETAKHRYSLVFKDSENDQKTEKEDIVRTMKAFIPNFEHMEKGKNLDQKM